MLNILLNCSGVSKKIKDDFQVVRLGVDGTNIKDIKCTYDTLLILFSNGEFICKRMKRTLSVDEITLPIKILKISSGFCHLHLLSYDNKLYGLGSNSFNQIGFNNLINNKNDSNNWHSTIKQVEYFNDITLKMVSSGGRNHTIFIGIDGSVYTCGSNKYSQLGRRRIRRKGEKNRTTADDDDDGYGDDDDDDDDDGDVDDNIYNIEKLETTILFDNCSSGDYHNLLITPNGLVYGFGSNSHGQLGIVTNYNNNKNSHYGHCIKSLTLLETLKDECIIETRCSMWHSVLLSKKGQVFTFGQGSSFQLGHGDNISYQIPTIIDELSDNDYKINSVSCSTNSSLFLDNKHRVFYCGDNFISFDDHQNLDSNDKKVKDPTPITQLTQTLDFSPPNNIYTHSSNFNFMW
ncbi:hypothetical protein RB653_000810 [Dictyostelium firmibasis]|uniref:Regulator of chromosome condensation domain-containing protein n=1 Tax=Dictyostelium firmibasis TaxID=79012 RepID=A0AAN7YUM8_9MYCE